ncbi:uncharacterized protein LOC144116344 [Amblyomma americanum]
MSNQERAKRWLKHFKQAASSPEENDVSRQQQKVTVNDSTPTYAAYSANSMDDLQLACMNSTAAEAPLPTHADVDCQTAPSSSGRLTLLLYVTNGSEASTQVSHTELTDQVTLTDGSWKRSCGFSGFSSLEDNEEALQDLCGVTLPVFCLLLNLMPRSRYRRSDMAAEDKLCLFLTKLRLGIAYAVQAVMFNVTATTASNVFVKTLDILSVALQKWIFVPP